jgi:hypothetical protein
MIASPGDVQTERNIVREVVHEWNATNSASRKAVLLPIGWETHSSPLMGAQLQAIINWQVLEQSDLLIAVFWTRLGTPTIEAISGTVEEIEKHIAAGKPAMIYFSSAPVALDSVDRDQYDALTAFKKSCQSNGLYEMYESPSQFQDKVRRQLSQTLNSNPYFTNLLSTSSSSTTASAVLTTVPNLSREAGELLKAAVASGGDIMVLAFLGGSAVQASGRNFVEPGNPRSRAIWEGAVDDLEQQGFVQSSDPKRQVFRVTRDGYDAADLL